MHYLVKGDPLEEQFREFMNKVDSYCKVCPLCFGAAEDTSIDTAVFQRLSCLPPPPPPPPPVLHSGMCSTDLLGATWRRPATCQTTCMTG